MLMPRALRPRHGIVRRIVFPFSSYKQLFALIPLTVAAIVSAFIAQDLALFFMLLTLGYISVGLAMQRHQLHEMIISRGDLQFVRNFLDKHHEQISTDDGFLWNKKIALDFLRSELDQIAIKKSGQEYIVVGDKAELARVAKHLNTKLP